MNNNSNVELSQILTKKASEKLENISSIDLINYMYHKFGSDSGFMGKLKTSVDCITGADLEEYRERFIARWKGSFVSFCNLCNVNLIHLSQNLWFTDSCNIPDHMPFFEGMSEICYNHGIDVDCSFCGCDIYVNLDSVTLRKLTDVQKYSIRTLCSTMLKREPEDRDMEVSFWRVDGLTPDKLMPLYARLRALDQMLCTYMVSENL